MAKRYIFVAVVRHGSNPPELTSPWELVSSSLTDSTYHARLDEEFVIANQTRLMQAYGVDANLVWFNIQPEQAVEDFDLKLHLRNFLAQHHYGVWVGEGYSVRRTAELSNGEGVYIVTRLVEPEGAGYTRINGSWGSTHMRESEVRALFGSDTIGKVAYTGN